MNATSQHAPIYAIPALTSEDEVVLGEIHQMRKELRHMLRTPKRWEGGLRRSALAKAIQGSNSIEGYNVEEDDAAAAIDGDEPLSADQQTFLEIQGYQRALDYVLAVGDDKQTTFSAAELRAMHFMLLQHEPAKSPGRYRQGPIYVHDAKTDSTVYEGPDFQAVPALMESLVESLQENAGHDPLVRSAMAHLNLVMIHPFRDGNGRMARALATLVLTRSDIGEPTFSSIEEWLGANTEDYYAALALTGRGHWAPRADAQLWISFNLRAHHMQAQTVAQRIVEANRTWIGLDQLTADNALPERTVDIMFDAVLGYRIRRSGYIKRTGIEGHTATRDLAQLADSGVLAPHGTGRGRFYTAGQPLVELRTKVRSERSPLRDPYPWMRPKLAEPRDSGQAR
ncbi:Fic family protein [Nocardia altamirensis]|uniref:Fic family protein n=1 Tax=Nocardia altamirensis TaxID=472158 RepID=UPI0008404C17|nr:Fic family protein [Nocardia altamirensis]